MIDTSFWLTTLVVSITILLWALARLPEYLTALLFFAAAMLLSIAPASSVFSGFASSAFWLVLSGFVLGAAIRKVGLAQRWANWLVVPFSQSWPRMVAGTVLLSYLLALVMPSNMGRIALLMPVVLALGERAGIRPCSRGSIGLALAVGFGTFQLSASILPANVPNLVLSGAAENAYQLHLQWLPWWLLHMPVVGLGKGILLVACITLMFRAQPQPVATREALPVPQRARMAADCPTGRHVTAVDDRQPARLIRCVGRAGRGVSVFVTARGLSFGRRFCQRRQFPHLHLYRRHSRRRHGGGGLWPGAAHRQCTASPAAAA
ncbi:di/tricarboxylate transporter [Pantoea dispersa]|nr:di/tricarboxylate transporter [Pantoea dispersa]